MSDTTPLTELDKKPIAVVPLVLASIVSMATIPHLVSGKESVTGVVVGIGVIVGLCVPLVIGSLWLLRRPFGNSEVRRVVSWTLAGAIPITLLAIVVVIYQRTHDIALAHPSIITSWVTGVGAIGGFLTGFYDVRRIRRQDRYETTSRRLRALIEASPVAIVAIDSDGIVTDWSQAATDLFGWEREEVVGDPYPLVSPHKRAEFKSHLQRVNTGKTLAGVETERKRADSTTVDVRIWSSPIEHRETVDEHMIALVDITERKENRRERNLLSRAIEQADDAVLITDDEGTIEYVNDAFVEMFGYAREQAVGRTPRILKSGEHDESFYTALWETIADGEVFQAEVTNRRINGELLDVELTIAPVEDEGRVTHYVAIERDISDRKRDRQQLEVLNRFLRHNVRNAVSVIDGNVRQLDSELEEHSSQLAPIKQRTSELESAAEKVRAVQQALNIDTSEPVHVYSLLDSQRGAFAERHPDATLTLDVPRGLWVQANMTLGMAIEEALDNAVEHTERPTADIRVVATPAADDRVDICIIDDGPGIPDHERHVLEVEEESALTHGSGLGLWVMKWLVTSLGGDISIAERGTGGTVVTFTLPRATRREVVAPG